MKRILPLFIAVILLMPMVFGVWEVYSPEALEERLNNFIDLSIREDKRDLQEETEDPEIQSVPVSSIYNEGEVRAALNTEKKAVLDQYALYYAAYQNNDVVSMEQSFYTVSHQLNAFETHLNSQLSVSGLLDAISRAFSQARKDILNSGNLGGSISTSRESPIQVDPLGGPGLIENTYKDPVANSGLNTGGFSGQLGVIFLLVALAGIAFVAFFVLKSRNSF